MPSQIIPINEITLEDGSGCIIGKIKICRPDSIPVEISDEMYFLQSAILGMSDEEIIAYANEPQDNTTPS